MGGSPRKGQKNPRTKRDAVCFILLHESANKSIFGSSYSPEQVAAFESIARDNIQEKTNNKTNQKQAESNLLNYLNSLADSYGIKINIVEK
jgi:hypothetical protein